MPSLNKIQTGATGSLNKFISTTLSTLTVTGNASVGGNLSVTGNISAVVDITSTGALAVDDISFNEDTAPAGTVVYAVRDNTGDLTLNALTSKTINLAIAGTDQVYVADGSLSPKTTNDVDLGTSSLAFKEAFVRTIDTDGAVSLTIQRNNVTQITLDGTDIIVNDKAIRQTTTNTADLGTSSIAFREVFTRIIDTDGAQTLTVQRNNASQITMDGTTITLGAFPLVLTAGTNPAGSSVFIGHDNTGDLTVNALTGKAVHLDVNAVDVADFSSGSIVFNEGSNDVDFRVEGNGNANLLVLDGGLDNIGLRVAAGNRRGVAIQGNVTGGEAGGVALVGIESSTLAAQTDETMFGLMIQTLTVTANASQTHALASALYVDAPGKTGTGTITNMASLYVVGAPSGGGTGNYSIWVDAGTSRFDGDIIPASNKAGSIGVTGTRWLDVFSGNAATSGTSRIVKSTMVCPRCNVSAVRSTGGILAAGDSYDYINSFCPQCGVMLAEKFSHRPVFPITAPASIVLTDMVVAQQTSNTRSVRLEFLYDGEYRNVGYLDEFEVAEFEGGDETVRKNLIMKIALQEWEDLQHSKTMKDYVEEKNLAFKGFVEPFLKKELLS